MKQIIDKDNNVIDGMYRTEMGQIVVNDPNGYKKYLSAKKSSDDVIKLKKDLSDLTEKFELLMSTLNKENNRGN